MKSRQQKKEDGRKNNGGRREGSGRPAFEPTEQDRKQVQAMAGCGLPIEQIAVLIGSNGICPETLVKHFEREIAIGRARASLNVGKTLYEKAMNGDITAAIWWSKTQMGWREHKEPPAVTAENVIKTFADAVAAASEKSNK